MTADAPAPPPEFALEASDGPDGAHVLAVRGELDISTAPRLRDALREAADAERRTVVIDLSGSTFVDSTALGVIIAGMKALAPIGGRLALVNTSRPIGKTLAITGLDRSIAVGDSVESAVRALQD